MSLQLSTLMQVTTFDREEETHLQTFKALTNEAINEIKNLHTKIVAFVHQLNFEPDEVYKMVVEKNKKFESYNVNITNARNKLTNNNQKALISLNKCKNQKNLLVNEIQMQKSKQHQLSKKSKEKQRKLERLEQLANDPIAAEKWWYDEQLKRTVDVPHQFSFIGKALGKSAIQAVTGIKQECAPLITRIEVLKDEENEVSQQVKNLSAQINLLTENINNLSNKIKVFSDVFKFVNDFLSFLKDCQSPLKKVVNFFEAHITPSSTFEHLLKSDQNDVSSTLKQLLQHPQDPACLAQVEKYLLFY